MAETICTYARGILFYMLFMNLCMQLPGTAEYKQYIRFVFGLVLMLLCLKPMFTILGEGETMAYYLQKHMFELEMNDSNAQLFLAEESRKEAILTAYKEELTRQLEELLLEENLYVLRAEFDFCEAENGYGKIEKMKVVTAYQNRESRIIIEPIKIGEVDEAEKEFLSPMEIHIKNKLAGFYNVEESNIYVIVRETGIENTSSIR